MSLQKIFLPAAVLLFFPLVFLQAAQLPDRARAFSAAEQLREYHRSLTRQHSQKNARSGFSMPTSRASITVNTAAATTSHIFFYDGAESGTNGWTTENYSSGTGLWHQVTLQSSSPSHSWWAGIDSSGTYETGDRVNCAAITPAIDLTSATGSLTLLFAENHVTELGWDYCMVDVTTDHGTTWTPLRGDYGEAPSGNSFGWQITSLDLSPYAGATVNVRFHFDTHDAKFNDFPGWFVDDIMIFDQSGMATGRTYFDANQNGALDPGEQGLKGWTITATGPVTVTTTTNFRGRYRLPLPLGDYTITETAKSGWTQTGPAGNSYSITLADPDTLADSLVFGNFQPTSFINGMVFHDLNRNGAYDAGDTLINGWSVFLTDTSGNEIDFDWTDSTGEYSLFAPAPGRYIVSEVQRHGWIQSYPADDFYTLDIPDLHTMLTDEDFGNYKTDTVQAIAGWNYNDRNRNGIQEPGETGAVNFTIQLFRKNQTPNFHLWKHTRTDSLGYYRFASLPPDTYKVVQIGQDGWWPSTAESIVVPLQALEYKDSVTFGMYEIAPSAIHGTVFDDANGNGVKDPEETGIPNWRVNLSGSVSVTVISNSSGDYEFTGIWPGAYIVSEASKAAYVQTFPSSPGVHAINLAPEENRTGIDFGNIDSNYTGMYRTFTSDSLALGVNSSGKHAPITPKAISSDFSALFVNRSGATATDLIVFFKVAPNFSSMNANMAGNFSLSGGKPARIQFTLDTHLPADQSVILQGKVDKPKLEGATSFKWILENGHSSVKDTAITWKSRALRAAMPNAINLLQAVGTRLKVGLGGAHSFVSGTYKDIVGSLVENRDRTHAGTPRCLDKFSAGGSMKTQQKSLPPKRHNNMLFAEAIALQANIRASLAGKTPKGFGGLVYDDGLTTSAKINGMTIIEIAASLDKYMSSYNDADPNPSCAMPSEWGGFSVDTLYNRIKMINGSFSGPIDTMSFGDSLQFSGVRPLSDVPYLRYDAAAAARAALLAGDFQSIGNAIPDRFTLYQNYPNPFNPTTNISFDLPGDMIVTITIYNMLGQEVSTLIDREEMTEGNRSVQFDGSHMASGVYFYRVTATPIVDADGVTAGPRTMSVGRMVLIK